MICNDIYVICNDSRCLIVCIQIESLAMKKNGISLAAGPGIEGEINGCQGEP